VSFFDADRIGAPAQLDLLLPKLSRPALSLADNALSHPEQIRDYLLRVDELPGIAHIVIPIGKGLSVAHLP
jgi:predicted O-methyltransferase YrrM